MSSNNRKSRKSDKVKKILDKAKTHYKENEETYRKLGEKAQEKIREAKEDADQAGQDAKVAREELAEGKEEGNPREEKEAEDVEGKAEKELAAAEQEEAEAIKAEERQIKQIKSQEEIVENLQNESKQLFEAALKDLGGLYKRFQKVQSEEYDTKLTKKDYEEVEIVLERLEEALYVLNTSIDMAAELTGELENLEQEESYVENISSEISQETQFMEKTDKGLMEVFAQLQDQEGERKAKAEAQQLKKEEQKDAKEENEERKIDEAIKNEDMELEKIIKGDEQLLDYVQKSINSLEDLYKLLSNEKSIWNHILGANPPLQDIQNVHDQLRDAYGAEKEELSSVEEEESKIRAGFSKLGSATSSTARANTSVIKYVGIAAVVLIVAILAYGMFSANF